jgi:hypothetical protein
MQCLGNGSGSTVSFLGGAAEKWAAALATLSAEALEWVYRPDYDPSAVPPPRNYQQVLDDYPRAAGATG